MTIFAHLKKTWPTFRSSERAWSPRLLLFGLLFALAFALPAGAAQNSCELLFSPSAMQVSAPSKAFRYWDYYLNKLREMTQLDRSAPVAMTLRFLILTTSAPSVKEFVPIQSLKLIHPITRDAATEKLNDRVEALMRMPPEILNQPIREEVLNQYIPSKNSLRAIETDEGDFVVFDGNGRLVALQKSLPIGTTVEVEVFRSRSQLLQKTLRKLRTMRNVY